MTVHSLLDAARLRTARALSSARGAFDLPSIITGVVVVAILAGGVFAAVFGVIPFAQDHGAKQDLAAVRTAEGVAKAKDGAYVSGAALDGSGYLSARTGLAIGADEAGSCWVGFVKSGAGTVFYATDAVRDPQTYTAGTDTGCLSAEEQAGLLAATGAAAESPSTQPSAAPEPEAPPVTLAAWGYNRYGALGTEDGNNRSSPAPVRLTGSLDGKSYTSISGGRTHACAISDGAVHCWGGNDKGQLGNGTTTDSFVPVHAGVSGAMAGKTVSAVFAGADATCAIAEGKAYCWGDNGGGRLGNGTTAASSVPVAVTANTGLLAGRTVTAMSLSLYHTCAIASGKAYCWGTNLWGALGNNSTVDSSVPVAVSTSGVLNGQTIENLAAGSTHTCALASGKVSCWGDNTYGQVGDNSTVKRLVPTAVYTNGGLYQKTVTSLAGGSHSTCVLASGKPYCWGSNGNAQLGNGSPGNANSSVPVVVTGAFSGKTVTSLSSGSSFRCGVADAVLYCWGRGFGGALGNGDTADSYVPVAVDTSGVLSGRKMSSVTLGAFQVFVTLE